jgi:uncharacterized SAM-binding protein YcdF (DUF218 family)
MEEFEIGKWLWTIATPSFLLILLLALAVLTARRWINDVVAGMIALVLLVAAILPLGEWAMVPLETCAGDKPQIPAQVNGVIVLGGAMDERISKLRNEVHFNGAGERFYTLLKLMRTYPNATFVYTGASGRLQHQDFKEADLAKKAIEDIGMDTSRVIFENKARNTAENVEFTKPYFEKGKGQHWLIVTSAMHIPRSLSLFAEEGEQSYTSFYPYPVDYQTPGRFQFEFSFDLPGNLGKLDAAMKEYVGMAYNHFVKGRTQAFLTCRAIKRTPPS